jgi:beta-glucosidase-like glycosyl hydrolase
MCSTNRVNGVDACMNDAYLNGFLRERFNFSGFVVTDGNSCGNTNCRATVKLLKNATAAAEWTEEGHELAAELCLAGGTDIELGSTLSGYTSAAVAHGLVPEGSPSRSNTRLYTQMIAQGHLETGPLDQLGSGDVDTSHSRQVAFEAAVQVDSPPPSIRF